MNLNFKTVLISILGLVGGFLVVLGILDQPSVNEIISLVEIIVGGIASLISVIAAVIKDKQVEETENKLMKAVGALPPEQAREITG